ncbi:MAG: peptidylprolyl isomerase [Chloroflexi bacterium]|nr:peptidylprolyl isomerase [Chloroflexota bacterium]
MTNDRHDRRQQEKLQRRRQRRTERQAHAPAAVSGPAFEFPGIMGWMQRNMRVLFLGGIVVLFLSLGAGTFFSSNSTSRPRPTETPTATPSATASTTPTAPASPTPQRTYSAPPSMTIAPNKQYEAVIALEKGGEVRIELLAKDAPKSVNNFVFLAKNNFFDGLTFHRVLQDFVAQGGDPSGTGSGGPGYFLEVEKNTVPLAAGVIAMAKSPAGVSGSQFFITLTPQPGLQPDFTAFGRVTAGMEVVRQITLRDPSKPNQPKPDVIKSITIVEKG